MRLELPVTALRARFRASVESAPVVLSSPTGSGKSTEVPRWRVGRVLVVEPRRIACRSLATRVAELEGTGLGEGVGYVVRDEHRATAAGVPAEVSGAAHLRGDTTRPDCAPCTRLITRQRAQGRGAWDATSPTAPQKMLPMGGRRR